MEQKELEARLKEMQDKVMGGQNIIDETKKQEAILRKTANDLEKKAVRFLFFNFCGKEELIFIKVRRKDAKETAR
jgi:hypothetical protein